MKILFLLSRIEQTGVTTHTIDLVEGLVAKGHEICLITGGKILNASSRVDEFYNDFLNLGVTIKEFKTPRGNIFSKGITTISSVFAMRKMIKEFNPQVIHCQSPYMTFVPWLMGKKFTTTIHILFLKKNFKYKNPEHLIAISQESYEFSKKVFGMKDEDITLIHHGVSKRYAESILQPEKDKLKARFGIPKDRIVLGFVGSISMRKGIDVLVKGLRDLSPETKDKIHFVLLGGNAGTDKYIWMEEMINEANLTSIMSLVPFEDPKPFYDIFDVFLLPSRMESFPLVTVEAMMSHCCIIRSNTEGAYEQVDNEVDGLLFENENHQQLTAVLERVVANPELRNTFADQAKSKALREFTIPVMTEKTLEVYERIKLY